MAVSRDNTPVIAGPGGATIAWRDECLVISGLIEPAGLLKKLQYWKKSSEVQGYRRKLVNTLENLYCIAPTGEIITMPGFLFRVRNVLKEKGVQFQIVDARSVFPKPELEAAMDGLWPTQQPLVYNMIMSGGGIMCAPTGYGKTAMAAGIIRAFKRDELALRGTPLSIFACPERDINAKNFVSLRRFLPDRQVGIMQSGHRKIVTDDVMVVTLDSLHNLDLDQVGLFICDEVHTGVSTSRSEQIQAMEHAIKYGVSATPGGRYDGRDIVIEALFGPVVARKTYQEAVIDGVLVPIKVVWINVPQPDIGMTRYSALKTREGKCFQGVVRNNGRNAIIGSLLATLPDSMQTIAITPTIEHISRIRMVNPEVRVVHAETNKASLDKRGLANIPAISTKDRKKIYEDMSNGTIRKIVSTYVYKQGVDFPALSVMINAGGGGSEIAAKQIPGRASRNADGKDCAYLVDFWHPWDRKDTGMGKQADGPIHKDDKQRSKFYEELGFEQVWCQGLTEAMTHLCPVKEEV